MPDDLKVIEPDPAVPVDSVKKPKQDATTEMFEDADVGTDVSPDDELDKKAFWAGFAEKCEACGVNALELYKQAKEKKKIKKLHKALKRDKPVVSADQKALIDKNKGEKNATFAGMVGGGALGTLGGLAASPLIDNSLDAAPNDQNAIRALAMLLGGGGGAALGHALSGPDVPVQPEKKANVLGGLAGAGLGGGLAAAAAPSVFNFGGRSGGLPIGLDELAQILSGLTGAGAGAYLGHKATEDKK